VIALEQPLVPTEEIRLVWLGIDHAEGLAVDDDGTVWCGGEEGQVYRGRLDGEPEVVARLPGDARTGGFAIDAEGNAYCAAAAEAGLFRITPAGRVDVVSTGAPGRPAVLPNHPAFLPSGVLLYTDSGTWGEDDGCIYAVAPDGSTTVADTSASRFPNGLCVAPDGRTLVVVESSLPGLSALTIEDGSLGGRRVLVELEGTVPDGVVFDERERVLVACWAPDAIFLLETDGRLRTVAHDPLRYALHEPTNVAFVPGTRTLVSANYGERFLSVLEHETRGAPLSRPPFPWTP
jgi:sugar lactone lactonase YvrE